MQQEFLTVLILTAAALWRGGSAGLVLSAVAGPERLGKVTCRYRLPRGKRSQADGRPKLNVLSEKATQIIKNPMKESDHAKRPCSLRDLDDARCRFPISDINDIKGLQFCGSAVMPGRSYCPHHYNIALHQEESPLTFEDHRQLVFILAKSAQSAKEAARRSCVSLVVRLYIRR
jgi:hypothetical protein